jgi:hypothetical protein
VSLQEKLCAQEELLSRRSNPWQQQIYPAGFQPKAESGFTFMDLPSIGPQPAFPSLNHAPADAVLPGYVMRDPSISGFVRGDPNGISLDSIPSEPANGQQRLSDSGSKRSFSSRAPSETEDLVRNAFRTLHDVERAQRKLSNIMFRLEKGDKTPQILGVEITKRRITGVMAFVVATIITSFVRSQQFSL